MRPLVGGLTSGTQPKLGNSKVKTYKNYGVLDNLNRKHTKTVDYLGH